jgi:DNA-binding NarL/FixJ family response regulator
VQYPVHRAMRDRWLVPVRRAIRRTDIERWWGEGGALSTDEAVALAEMALPVAASTVEPPIDPATLGPLTPRQQEVAVLVAQGLTNRQIAERLVVTERAAAAHVEHILTRLGIGSRTQIGVWASERGLLAKLSD